jgi:hypothetical protein
LTEIVKLALAKVTFRKTPLIQVIDALLPLEKTIWEKGIQWEVLAGFL